MEQALVDKMESFIKEKSLLRTGDSIVAAVSGGPDSVAMLHLLFTLSPQWQWRLVVAHVNHQFRGEEADREAEFVGRFAARLGLPCEIAEIDIPYYMEETGKNGQAAAREKRYAFLYEVAERHGATAIALAHHADDQAETVLMRILRGTSASGLAGMPYRRKIHSGVELVRPLIRIYKSELVRYCEQQRLEYCIDSSNLEKKYTRNRIRLEVMPELMAYNERLPQALNRLAETAEAENDYMDEAVRQWFEAKVRSRGGQYRLSAADFAARHVALQRRLIKLILSCLSAKADTLDYSKIEQLRQFIVTGTGNVRLEIGEDIVCIREYDSISLHRMVLPPSDYCYRLDEGTSELLVSETGVRLLLRHQEGALYGMSRPEAMTAAFDAGELLFPLKVRSRLPGDRMEVFGLNGTKKVKDIFIDAKVPPSLRRLTPMIEDAAGRIIWLPGVRRSPRALIKKSTAAVLLITVVMPE